MVIQKVGGLTDDCATTKSLNFNSFGFETFFRKILFFFTKNVVSDKILKCFESIRQNRIPDAMYLALPLLVFPKTVNYQSLKNIDGFRYPSNRCEQLYLAYAVRAWDLIGNKKAAIRTQGAIADHFSKYDRDQKFFKEFGKAMTSHSWSPYDWQRKSQTFLILSRLVQQCPIERLMVLGESNTVAFDLHVTRNNFFF